MGFPMALDQEIFDRLPDTGHPDKSTEAFQIAAVGLERFRAAAGEEEGEQGLLPVLC